MALVLSLREGQDFYVGEAQVVIDKVDEDASFVARVVASGKTFDCSEAQMMEILPDVLVSSGGFQSAGLLRVAIDAPQSIGILRGELYRSGASPRRRPG